MLALASRGSTFLSLSRLRLHEGLDQRQEPQSESNSMVVSERVREGLDGDGSCFSNLGEDAVKSTGLQRVVQEDCDRVDWRSLVPQPHVAALLTDHPVAEVFQRANYAVRGHAARQLHAASTWINSSLT